MVKPEDGIERGNCGISHMTTDCIHAPDEQMVRAVDRAFQRAASLGVALGLLIDVWREGNISLFQPIGCDSTEGSVRRGVQEFQHEDSAALAARVYAVAQGLEIVCVRSQIFRVPHGLLHGIPTSLKLASVPV